MQTQKKPPKNERSHASPSPPPKQLQQSQQELLPMPQQQGVHDSSQLAQMHAQLAAHQHAQQQQQQQHAQQQHAQQQGAAMDESPSLPAALAPGVSPEDEAWCNDLGVLNWADVLE